MCLITPNINIEASHSKRRILKNDFSADGSIWEAFPVFFQFERGLRDLFVDVSLVFPYKYH